MVVQNVRIIETAVSGQVALSVQAFISEETSDRELAFSQII
jgi:hypothetical protein